MASGLVRSRPILANLKASLQKASGLSRSVLHVDDRGFGLADLGEEAAEPGGGCVEGFAAFDAGELDGAEDAALVFVVADRAAGRTPRRGRCSF